MNRAEILDWLHGHPGSVHGEAEEILARCERPVRRHAAEDAWLAAKRVALERGAEWRVPYGSHASEAYVARELCHALAHELRRREPHMQHGDEDDLAGGVVIRSLEAEAWEVVRTWILELAEEERRRTWDEIVRFTDAHGRDLARERNLCSDARWDTTRSYSTVAEELLGHIAREYSLHAHPRH